MKINHSGPIIMAVLLSLMVLLGRPLPCPAQQESPSFPFEKNVLEKQFIWGGVPKSVFKTGVLYNLGPVFSRERAISHDGTEFRTPLTHRQIRQIMFELDKNKLNDPTLPRYLDFLRAVGEYQWQNSHDNRQPVLIVDVDFEWFDQKLENYPQLFREPDGKIRLKNDAITSLPTRKDRFFCGGLLKEDIEHRLVTFALEKEFIFSNSRDPVKRIEMALEDWQVTLSDLSEGHSAVVDLGNRPGIKKIRLTATRESGKKAMTFIVFNLKKPASGKFPDTVMRKGKAVFPSTRLPVVRFQQPSYLKQLTEEE